METSGTGKGPIQSVTPVHLSNRAPEREDAPHRLSRRDGPEFIPGEPVVVTVPSPGDGYTVGQLPALIYQERFSPHTPLPFIAQQIAQETSHSVAAKGLLHYRNVASTYQRVEGSDLRFFTSPFPISLRA